MIRLYPQMFVAWLGVAVTLDVLYDSTEEIRCSFDVGGDNFQYPVTYGTLTQ
jgi:hypothetical protein